MEHFFSYLFTYLISFYNVFKYMQGIYLISTMWDVVLCKLFFIINYRSESYNIFSKLPVCHPYLARIKKRTSLLK